MLNEKKKYLICHISQSAGGVEHYILNIIQYSDYQLFEHIVICSDNGSLGKRAKKEGATVCLVPMKREINLFYDLYSILKILILVFQIKPTIIHAHSGKGGIFGRLTGMLLMKPVIFTPHSFSYLGYQGLKKTIIKSIEVLFKYTGAKFLPSSNSERNRAILEIGWNVNNVLPIFKNSISINDNEIIQNKTSKKIKFINLARLSRQKDPILFLEIAKAVHEIFCDSEFVIVGAGYGDELSVEVNQFISINRMESFVKILSWVSDCELDNYLRDSDIFLFTSKYEGLPTVLLKAMEYRLPVVATRVDGNIDVVKHNITGFLFNEIPDLIDSCLTLAKNPLLRKDMGFQGYLYLKNSFEIKNNIKILEKAYQSFQNN